MTPSINRKEPSHYLPPSSNKNLPPRPNHPPNLNNNISYKMPPRPTPLVSSKQNNSVDYSRSHSKERPGSQSGRDRSKENLIRAGQQILM